MFSSLSRLISRIALSKKIAILLIAPISIQLLLSFSLSALFEKNQRLAEAEAQQTELIEGLDLLFSDRGEAWASILNRTIFNNSAKTVDAATYKDKIAKDFERVRHAENPNPDLLRLVDEIERTYTEEYQLLKAIEETRGMQDDSLQRMKVFRQALKTLSKRAAATQRQIVMRIDSANQTRLAQRAARDSVQRQLLLGIAVNLLAAAGTLLLFVRSLNERLSKLTKNAMAVPTSDALPYSVEGNDELALLDSVLHSAHKDLREARRDRQALNAMIAHDLRSPLTAVRLIIESLFKLEAVKESGEILKKAEALDLNINRVFTLIEDLLTVEKLESGMLDLHLGEVDLSKLVADSFTVVEEAARAKSITLVDETQPLSLIADRDRLLQVLGNYLSNAIKFAPAESRIRVFSVKKEAMVTVSVQDEGPGIALDDQFQLFEKFYRTAAGKRHSGFGLGLAICKMLIAMHKGEVGVTTKLGSGAVFWFSLPYDDEP